MFSNHLAGIVQVQDGNLAGVKSVLSGTSGVQSNETSMLQDDRLVAAYSLKDIFGTNNKVIRARTTSNDFEFDMNATEYANGQYPSGAAANSLVVAAKLYNQSPQSTGDNQALIQSQNNESFMPGVGYKPYSIWQYISFGTSSPYSGHGLDINLNNLGIDGNDDFTICTWQQNSLGITIDPYSNPPFIAGMYDTGQYPSDFTENRQMVKQLSYLQHRKPQAEARGGSTVGETPSGEYTDSGQFFHTLCSTFNGANNNRSIYRNGGIIGSDDTQLTIDDITLNNSHFFSVGQKRGGAGFGGFRWQGLIKLILVYKAKFGDHDIKRLHAEIAALNL